MYVRRTPRTCLFMACALAVALFAGMNKTVAQELPEGFRLLRIPTQQMRPEVLRGLGEEFLELESVTIGQLRRLDEASRDAAVRRVCTKAAYKANLSDDLLISSAECLIRADQTTRTVQWAASEMTIVNPEWEDGGRLVLGRLAPGAIGLLVSPAAAEPGLDVAEVTLDRTLKFAWIQQAKLTETAQSFQISLPPSLLSELEIELPKPMIVNSPMAHVTSRPSPNPDNLTWKLQWAEQDLLVMNILEKEPKNVQPAVLFSRETMVELSHSDAIVTSSIALTPLGDMETLVELDCPDSIRIFDVQGSPIGVREYYQKDGRLRIDLDSRVGIGQEINLVVKGIAAGPVDRQWALPILVPRNGRLDSRGQTSHRTIVTSPNHPIREVNVSKGRVVSDADLSSSASLVVEHFHNDSELTLTFQQKTRRVECSVQTVLQAKDSVTAEVAVEYLIQSGEMHEIRIELPRGWPFERVEWPTAESEFVTSVIGIEEGKKLLIVRPVRPLLARQTPHVIRLILTGPTLDRGDFSTSVDLPIVKPRGIALQEWTGTVALGQRWNGLIDQATGLEFDQKKDEQGLVLTSWRCLSLDAAAQLIIEGRPLGSACEIETEVEYEEHIATIEFLIRPRRKSQSPDRYLVDFRDIEYDLVWQLPSGVVAQRVSPDEAVWEITTPANPLGVELKAALAIPFEDVLELSLPHVQGGQTEGTLRLKSNSGLALNFGIQGLRASPVDVRPTDHKGRLYEWSYVGPAEIKVNPTRTSQESRIQIRNLDLVTDIDAAGTTVNQLSMIPSGAASGSFAVSFPPGVRILSAGPYAEISSDSPNQVFFDLNEIVAGDAVQLRYESDMDQFDLWGDVRAILPNGAMDYYDLKWTIRSPAGYAFYESKGGLQVAVPVETNPLYALFGTLSKPQPQWFEFWNSAAWSGAWNLTSSRVNSLIKPSTMGQQRSLVHVVMVASGAYSAVETPSVTLIRRSRVSTAAVFLVGALLILLWCFRRFVSTCRLLTASVTVVGFMVLLLMPPALLPVGSSLVWAGVLTSLGTTLLGRKPQIPADRSTIRTRGFAAALFIGTLFIPLSLAQQTNPAPSATEGSIILLPADTEVATTDDTKVLIPTSVLNRLRQIEHQNAPENTVFVTSALIQLVTQTGRMDVNMALAVDVPVDGAILELPWSNSVFRLSRSSVAPVFGKNGLQFQFEKKGSQELILSGNVGIDLEVAEGKVVLPLPEAPSTRLDLLSEKEFEFTVAGRVPQRVSEEGERKRLVAEIGGRDSLDLKWNRGDTRAAVLSTEQLSVVHWGAETSRWSEYVRIRPDVGRPDSVRITYPDHAVLLGVYGAGYESHERIGPSRSEISFDNPINDTSQFRFDFVLLDTQSDQFQVPTLKLERVVDQKQTSIVTLPPSHRISEPDELDPAEVARVLQRFGLSSLAGDLQWMSDKEGQAVLDREVVASVPKLDISLELYLERNVIRFSAEIKCPDAAGRKSLGLVLQEGVKLDEVSPGTDTECHVSGSELLWESGSGYLDGSEMKLTGTLMLEGVPTNLFAVRPCSGEVSGSIKVWHDDDIVVGEIETNSLKDSEDSLEPRSNQHAAGNYLIDSLDYSLSLQVHRLRSVSDAVVITEVVDSDIRELIWHVRLQFDECQRIVIELPENIQTLKVAGENIVDIKRTSTELTVTLETPVPNGYEFEVRAEFERAFTALPFVIPRQCRSLQQFLVIPADLLELVSGLSSQIAPLERIPRFQAEEDQLSFSLTRQRESLALPLSVENSDRTNRIRTLFEHHEVHCNYEEFFMVETAIELMVTMAGYVDVQLPPRAAIHKVLLNGQPTAVLENKDGQYRIRIASDGIGIQELDLEWSMQRESTNQLELASISTDSPQEVSCMLRNVESAVETSALQAWTDLRYMDRLTGELERELGRLNGDEAVLRELENRFVWYRTHCRRGLRNRTTQGDDKLIAELDTLTSQNQALLDQYDQRELYDQGQAYVERRLRLSASGLVESKRGIGGTPNRVRLAYLVPMDQKLRIGFSNSGAMKQSDLRVGSIGFWLALGLLALGLCKDKLGRSCAWFIFIVGSTAVWAYALQPPGIGIAIGTVAILVWTYSVLRGLVVRKLKTAL